MRIVQVSCSPESINTNSSSQHCTILNDEHLNSRDDTPRLKDSLSYNNNDSNDDTRVTETIIRLTISSDILGSQVIQITFPIL